LACNPAEDGSCLLSEHLSSVDESAYNPKAKSLRQTGRTPFNLGHNDLANDNQLIVGRAVTQNSNSDRRLLPILHAATYRNSVQALSGLNSVIDFAKLAVSLPKFFSKMTLS
jgi:hypothetical protein